MRRIPIILPYKQPFFFHNNLVAASEKSFFYCTALQIFQINGRDSSVKQTYTRTLTACYTGYVVQAIVNNFAPLLFLTFQSTYGISMGRITLLITINFIIQLMTDFLSAGFVDRIGYRASMLIAHAASAAGLICLPLSAGTSA